MVGKHTGDLIKAFFLGSKNTTVTSNYAIVTVDNDRIDKSKFSKRGTQLFDLLRGMGAGIVCIGHQLLDWNELQLCSCVGVHMSPHAIRLGSQV